MIAMKNDWLKIGLYNDRFKVEEIRCRMIATDIDDQRLTFLLEYFLFISYFIYPYFIIMSKNYVSL